MKRLLLWIVGPLAVASVVLAFLLWLSEAL